MDEGELLGPPGGSPPPTVARHDAAGSSTLLGRTLSLKDAIEEKLPTQTVVKIYTTDISPSYLMPWQVLQQRKWTGTGFILTERRILTNAHVVENATVLQVQKQGNPKKWRSHAVCVAHDIDLAVISVEDDAFWKDLQPAEFATGLPELYSEVKAVGFPQGGSTVCVTKGVLSRIDAQLYVHPCLCGVVGDTQNSSGNVLVLQIDAAINPGNSGGPTFDSHGRVVGVASSGMPKAQNVGYIIPASVAQLFLNEVRETGRWSGVSELGLTLRSLESDSLRQYLKMPAESTGVLVDRVAPLGALCGVMQCGDVITQIDGHDVSNEGKVPIEANGQKVFVPGDALVTNKAKGGSTSFRILRDGSEQEISAVAIPIPPLAPRFHGYDCVPEYLVVGGLVFTKVTVPLKREYAEAAHARSLGSLHVRSAVWDAAIKAYKGNPDHELVILLRILEHDINIGCPSSARVLEAVNDDAVHNLRELAQSVAAALKGEERFIRFRFKRDDDTDSGVPDIVLERAKVQEANNSICNTNRIRCFASENLRGYFDEVTPTPA